MSEEKIYTFGDAGHGTLDPNLFLAMNGNGGFGGGMWNNPIWAIVFLAALRNGGIFGNNGNCGDAAFVSSQLGQAIAGNANALSNLSTHLDCSIGQVQTGIAAVQSAIQNVANQTGMSGMQVINAINSGNAGLANQLQSCCCDIKTAVTQGFGNLRYEEAASSCAIKQNTTDNTNRILAKIDAVQDEAKNNKIAELTAQLTAANSRAERQAELAPIYKALSDIQCKQPKTETVYAPSVATIPQCVAWQIGLNGLGYPYGYQPGGSIWS